ncbi:MAG: DUF2306 domain-containing protein [Bacteroidota bacterium]
MEQIVSGTTGLIHLIVSIIALITGLAVLVMTKGTKKHKRVGYIYAISMILLNVTAFMIYKVYGKFGLFHWLAVGSCLTLFAGLYPVLTKSGKNYLLKHFNFMYWSVVGLYTALMAEIFSRLPKIILTDTGNPTTAFYNGVGIGIGVVTTIAILFYIKYKPKWTKQYEEK